MTLLILAGSVVFLGIMIHDAGEKISEAIRFYARSRSRSIIRMKREQNANGSQAENVQD